ncbi:hypothetical protein DV736_g881, partial [Chaetothyriales sp. CBS 134916]
MADADADAPPTATTTLLPADEDVVYHDNVDDDDGDDDGVDFRFLTTTAASSSSSSAPRPSSRSGSAIPAQGLPKRGTKDFEPNATQLQRHTLSASRRAMYDALSVLRVHAAGRTRNVGLYVNWERPEEQEQWRRRVGADDENLVEWRKRWCVVFHFKGVHGKTLGKSDRRGWTWLLPEEALYLLERGSLDIRDNETPPPPLPPPIGTLPMSLQGAYASFIGKSGLTLERYLVYAGLKRSGYVVQRAPTWDDESDGHVNGNANHHSQPPAPAPPPTSAIISSRTTRTLSPPVSLIHRLLLWLINPRIGTSNPCVGPLLAPGLYRNYNDVFRALALIPYHSTTAVNPLQATCPATRTLPKSPFTISWLVYKPSTSYRKSAPPSPDYRVCVVDARATTVPSMTQIGDLLDTMPDEQGTSSSREQEGRPRRIEVKIKLGRRSVLVAVVDLGVPESSSVDVLDQSSWSADSDMRLSVKNVDGLSTSA